MKSRWQDTLTQGLVAGVLGYATTALLFALANLLQGRSPFYTAAALGAAFFYGVHDPAQITISPGFVFAYNGAHLLVFLALGMLAAWLARVADRGAQLWYVGLFFLIFVSFHLIAVVQVIALPMRAVIPDTDIWAAGIVAAAVMGTYLLAVHPAIRTAQSW